MRKYISILFFTCMFPFIIAQNRFIEGRVIDKTTKEPLPYASIYLNKDNGTISNEEGFFMKYMEPQFHTITFSYVGYEKKEYKIEQLPEIVELLPLAINLSEVIITPIDYHEIIKRIFNKYSTIVLKKEHETNHFFYRQTTKTDKVCNEILETFFDAIPILCLQDLQLVEGRYAKIPSDSINQYTTFTNFFQYSQISPLDPKKDSRNKIIMPLRKDYNDYYNVYGDVLSSENNDLIYRIFFSEKKENKRPILEGVLFIDPQNLAILKFEGEAKNIPPTLRDKQSYVKSHKLRFSAIYKQIKELPIVESVNIKNTYTTTSVDKDRSTEINSILYNVASTKKNKGKKINPKDHLIELIAKRKYSPDFWINNEIIKRTPLEDSAVSIFEKENKFGTYSNE